MERTIIGFDQDELGDWRAILVCGHRQHVRHNPPLVNRPWVLTTEGRNRFLGVALACKACDEGEPVSEAMIAPDALEAVYARFHTDLYRFILSRVSDPDTAEDILQDVYLKVHTHAGDLRDSDRLVSWVYQIARNALVDHYRRARPQAELPEHLALPEADEPTAMADLAPSVRAFLACLPGKYRQALIMVEYQGLKQHEIAERLGISLSGAKSRVQRGREMIREALLDCCHFEFDRHGHVLQYQPRCAACAADDYPCPPETADFPTL